MERNWPRWRTVCLGHNSCVFHARLLGILERPALEMDLSIATPALSSQVPATMRDNEVQEVPDDPFGVTPEGRAEGEETGLNLSDFHDRFQTRALFKRTTLLPRGPSGVRQFRSSAFLGRKIFCSLVTDSSDVVPESGASFLRGYADVGGELRGPGAGANPPSYRDLAATAGVAAPPSAGADSRLRRGQAAVAGCASDFFLVRGSLLAFDVILLLQQEFVLWGQELALAYAAIVQLLLGARRQALVDR